MVRKMPKWSSIKIEEDSKDKYNNDDNFMNPEQKTVKILNHKNYKSGFVKSTEFLMEELTDGDKLDMLLKKQEKLEIYINVGMLILLFILLRTMK